MEFTQQNDFPKPMYKDLHAPKWAGNPKEQESLIKQGWTHEPRNIPPQKFPRAVWRIHDGLQVSVGNYDENGVVDLDKAVAELERLTEIEKTHSLTPVKVAAPVVMERPAFSGNAGTRIDLVEERLDRIEGTLGELMEHFRQSRQAKKQVGRQPVEA